MVVRRAWAWARTPWGILLSGTVVLVVLQRLLGLGYSPPGLYNDEASIGYNAWAVAHHGVDEHGVGFPLYFQAFGEYKNPLYVYMLAPLTWFLPLTAATERLPAALCGIGVCLAVAATAWTVTRSRAVTWLALVTAWVTPWAALEARVGFEVATMVLGLSVAVLCVARSAVGGAARGWRWGAGVALALTVFAYSTGRAFVLILVVAMAMSRAPGWLPTRRGLAVWVPVASAYLTLGLYGIAHPGALSSRYNVIGINADAPSLFVLAARFVTNYATYFGVPFLFSNGDHNLRHNSAYAGQLLVLTAPLLLAGLWACLRRWHEPLPRLLLVGLATAPIPAALTFEGTPHGLRAAAMLPFLLGILVFGWAAVIPRLRSRRLLAAIAGLALAIDGGGFLWDLYARYPDRTVTGSFMGGEFGTYPFTNYFDAGQQDAIMRGHALAAAAGGRLLLSGQLDQPGVQALFALTPTPIATGDAARDDAAELASVGVAVLDDAGAIAKVAAPGDVAVVAPSEAPPRGWVRAFSVDWTASPDHVLPAGTGTRTITLVVVYLVRGGG